ncbi:MAG: DUF3795 domain-containing protein [Gaiellales bacterium]|nr:DUF3795 domain-containing protein [Gaiellales bacterium]
MVDHQKHIPATLCEQLIAPCGMNCGLCLAYLRDKNRCVGCRGDDAAKPRSCVSCIIKVCDRRSAGSTDYCFECAIYPCARLRRLDKRYRTKYRMSMLGNLADIREGGVGEFLEHERQRWTCAGCGGVICVHRDKCLFCGHPIAEEGGEDGGDEGGGG